MNWKTIFDPENDFFRTLSRIVDIVGLSLLWFFCCIPLITIGSATAALYSTVLRCIRQAHDSSTYLHFLRSFLDNLKMGSVLTLLFLPFTALLWYALPRLAFWGSHGDVLSAVFFYTWQFFGLLILSYAALLFALFSRFVFSFKALLQTSLQLMIRHLPSILLCGILVYLATALCWNLWYPILFLPALTALCLSFLLERVFLRYAPPQEHDHIDSDS